MNKYQEALKQAYEMMNAADFGSAKRGCEALKVLQEIVDKATPKKLKSKTDKDGRLLLVCPNCGDVYMKFWSDVETVSCRKHCDECGQAIKWGDENE